MEQNRVLSEESAKVVQENAHLLEQLQCLRSRLEEEVLAACRACVLLSVDAGLPGWACGCRLMGGAGVDLHGSGSRVCGCGGGGVGAG